MPRSRSSLEGKVVAITGAAPGIGLACARECLNAGARVFLVDRAGDQLGKLCAELGPSALPLVADLTDPASVERMMPQILDKAGQLDVFHANAGSYIGGDLLDSHPGCRTGRRRTSTARSPPAI